MGMAKSRLIGSVVSQGARPYLVLMFCVAIVDLAIFLIGREILLQVAWHHYTGLDAALLPGIPHARDAIPFKAEVISYVLAQLIFFGSIGLFWLWTLWAEAATDREALPRNVAAAGHIRWPAATGIIAILLLLAAPMFFAWYPAIVPNDFFETSDHAIIQVHGKAVQIGRAQLISCLAGKSATPSCPSDSGTIRYENTNLINSLQLTAMWQSEAGRSYLHHSYVLVPAAHFLKYGLDRSVPYLYGYGNTISQALILGAMGGASMTHYFAALPWMEFTGLLLIVAMVGYITRSWLAAAAACALTICAFYSITYAAVFMAASFNPTRYIGVVFQIAAMVFAIRGKTAQRIWMLPAAAAFSFFWNTEFAVMGLLGQAFLILSPRLSLQASWRLAALAVTLLIGAFSYVFLHPDADIVNSVWLGFYNVGVPIFGPWPFPNVSVVIIAIEAALCISIATAFSGIERDVRFAILGVLSLILVKWIFNPSTDNLAFSFVLISPGILIFFPWRTGAPIFAKIPVQARAYGHVALLSAIVAGYGITLWNEVSEAAEFRRDYIANYTASAWTGLGETLPAITPEQPILERVRAIRAYIRPHDAVLFLSPFDEVMSFYVNPARYCGHFEVMSNLATRDISASIANCAKHGDALVVRDAALEIPCPEAEYDFLSTYLRPSWSDLRPSNIAKPLRTTCASKADLKNNLDMLFRNLSGLKKIGEQGPLTFYRKSS